MGFVERDSRRRGGFTRYVLCAKFGTTRSTQRSECRSRRGLTRLRHLFATNVIPLVPHHLEVEVEDVGEDVGEDEVEPLASMLLRVSLAIDLFSPQVTRKLSLQPPPARLVVTSAATLT